MKNIIKSVIRFFLNTYSKLIAFVAEGIDESELSEKDKQDIDEWLENCREFDALDGVVEVRKAIGDIPER